MPFEPSSRLINLTHFCHAITGSPPEIATFASGCFWGTEHIFLKHYPIKENKGILKSGVGFIGGHDDKHVSYRDVCSGGTGHAEAIRLEFDPAIVKYDELVGQSTSYIVMVHSDITIEFFYRTHDPTTENAQGSDRGSRQSSYCILQVSFPLLIIHQNIDPPSSTTPPSRRKPLAR
jgi:peptide-methionine (S)-S-oxide reductase